MKFHDKQEHPLFPLVIQGLVQCYSVLNSTFSLFVGGQRVWQIEGFRVSQMVWLEEVNRVGLAQRRSVVEGGSEARVSAWAFRRSTMSWWEAPSATNCAVCPFWGENRQNMSQRHIKDIAVAVLFLTVAVLCRAISRNRTLQYRQIHCTCPDTRNATRRAEFSI